MKLIKRLMLVFLSIGVFFLVINILEKPKIEELNKWTKKEHGDVLVMAHAGGKGLYPSNTKSAFDYSYSIGVDVLEMDVQMTSDNVLVLRHGENETGNIKQMSNCDTLVWKETYDYLYSNCNFGYNFQDDNGNYPFRDLSFSEWVEQKVYLTTLEELFQSYGDTILYNIEIKADGDAPREEIADELVVLLNQYNLLEEALVATAFDDISKYIAKTYPSVLLSTSHDEAQSMIIHSYSLTSYFYKPSSYVALQLPTSFELPVINELDLTTKLLINTAHDHNMAMHYWTINDPKTMRYLIEQGADGIITDYPELLMEVIKNYQEE